MKRILAIFGIMILCLWMTPAFADDLATIDIRANAVIIDANGREHVVPLYSIVSVYMDRSSKTYTIQYYSYYTERAYESNISKSDYEKLKRMLIKTEQ